MIDEDIAQRIRDAGLVLVLDVTPNRLREIADLAVLEGVQIIEVSASQGPDLPRSLAERYGDVVWGVGEVSSVEEVWSAVEVGARFISTPDLTDEIAAVCEASGVATVAVLRPGMDPNEFDSLHPDFVRFSGERQGWEDYRSNASVILEVSPEDETIISELRERGLVVAVRASDLASGSPDSFGARLPDSFGARIRRVLSARG